MDGAATMSEIREKYRTPTRILLPKLLKSRDDWKAKSDARKVRLKAAQVKIRDLTASREFWRQRAEQPQTLNGQRQEQLQQALRERDEARAEVEELKKNSTPARHDDATRRPISAVDHLAGAGSGP
jgi:chromosome segregation ATPase